MASPDDLDALRAYAAQFAPQQPEANPDIDQLRAYAAQMGLVDAPAPVANSTLGFAIPGVPVDVPFKPVNNATPTDADLTIAGAPPPTIVDARPQRVGIAGPGIATGPVNPNDPTKFVPTTDQFLADAKTAISGKIGAPSPYTAPADVTSRTATPDEGGEDDGGTPILIGGGGGFILPHQVDLLNPTGKDDTNRIEYDAGWNQQFGALNKKNQDLEIQTSNRMEALDAQRARAQQAYDDQKAMLTAQLAAQQDHAAAMANAKQWADSAADAAQKEAADAKVDQGHFFASRDAGQQIALVIGAALGALGSSLTNTPNYALQMIQGAMSDDMQAQQANLANKRASADSALKRALNATGDLDSAKSLVRLQQLQVAQNQIDSYAKMDLADEQKAKLMEIHDGLKEQIMSTRGQMMQDRALKDMQLRPMVGGGFVGGAGGAGNASDATNAKNSVSVPRSDGKGWDDYAVTNPEDRPELVEKSIAVRGAQQIANQIHEIVKKGGATWRTDPTLSAEMDSLRGQLSRVVKSKTGDSSDKDREALEGMVGDPRAWLANGDKVLAQFIANQSAQLRTRIKVINAEPIQRTRTVDATGRQHAGAILAPPIRGAGTMPPSKPLVPK